MMDRQNRAVWMSDKIWRKNRLAQSLALLTVVALAATGTFAVEDAAKVSSEGLRGIFPAAPPADLGTDEFAKLDGNWADWSAGAATAVADFYSKLETADSVAQRQALGVLKNKLDVMRRALDDPRYQSLFNPLTNLHNSLLLRIELAEAMLDTLDTDGSQAIAGKMKARSAELLTAISSLEDYLKPIANGSLWLPYFKVDAVKNALLADPLNPAARAAAAQSVAAMQGRDYVLDDTQKQFTHRAAFEAYSSALNHFAAVAAWNDSPEAKAKLRAELKTLSDALDNYCTSGQKASDLRHAFGRVRNVAVDGGDRIATSLQKRLFNYNLQLVASEAFLNKIMSQNRRETGPVSDFVMGAVVSGCQITDTTVTVNLKPSPATARFDLQLQGNIRSNTTGVTPQATVQTLGNHTFTAVKEINFDGLAFSTRPATISVTPRNTTAGITTKLSGVPILGRIANNIASQEIQNRSGQTNAIAASRVQDGVLPRFNKEVDNSFATEGAKLNNELFAGLRSVGLFPDRYNYQSTDQQLLVKARVMNDNQIAADIPEGALVTTAGATALLHETLVNNAIDQMGIAGQTLTEPQLRAKIETFLDQALGRTKPTDKHIKLSSPPPSEGGAEDKISAIIFAPTDPVRVQIQDDILTLVIRAGFKREGEDDIPMREVRVDIKFHVKGQQIEIERGDVVVRAADGEGGGIGVNAVVNKRIKKEFPDKIVDAKIELKGPEKTSLVYVKNVRLLDGWAAVAVD